MQDAKPWWESKTVWASLATVLLSVLATAGISIKTPPDDIAQAIITIIPAILTVIAGIGAAFGRARATAQITGTKAEARRLSARLAARAPAGGVSRAPATETSPGVFRAPPA